MTLRKAYQDRLLQTADGAAFKEKLATLKSRSLKIRETGSSMDAHKISDQFVKAKEELAAQVA